MACRDKQSVDIRTNQHRLKIAFALFKPVSFGHAFESRAAACQDGPQYHIGIILGQVGQQIALGIVAGPYEADAEFSRGTDVADRHRLSFQRSGGVEFEHDTEKRFAAIQYQLVSISGIFQREFVGGEVAWVDFAECTNC